MIFSTCPVTEVSVRAKRSLATSFSLRKVATLSNSCDHESP